MEVTVPLEHDVPSRDLIRALRTGLRDSFGETLPESVAWQLFLELRKRGEPQAGELFVAALRSLHSRRSIWERRYITTFRMQLSTTKCSCMAATVAI